mgnify:CR=1 FL=1
MSEQVSMVFWYTSYISCICFRISASVYQRLFFSVYASPGSLQFSSLFCCKNMAKNCAFVATLVQSFRHPPSCFLVPLPSFLSVRLPSLTYRNAYRCNSCRIYPFFLIFKPSHFSFRCAVLLISFYSAAHKIATRRKSR